MSQTITYHGNNYTIPDASYPYTIAADSANRTLTIQPVMTITSSPYVKEGDAYLVNDNMITSHSNASHIATSADIKRLEGIIETLVAELNVLSLRVSMLDKRDKSTTEGLRHAVLDFSLVG